MTNNWMVTLLFLSFFVADIEAQISVFLNLPADVVIPENTTQEEPVYSVRVNSRLISNFRVGYSFDSNNTADKFQVIKSDMEYIISVKCGVKLNFEDPAKEYNITFMASILRDNENPRVGRQAEAYFTQVVVLSISLSDVNESPSFGKDIYFLRVAESTGEQLSSLNMSADVTDEDINDVHFTFEIVKVYPDIKNLFEIDNSTGNIRMLPGYDIDLNNQSDAILLVVSAKDKNLLSGTTMLLVNIMDINDNAPEFGQEHQTVMIPQTLEVNSSIAYVKACDKDSGHNGKVQYGIQNSTFGNYFQIDKMNGIVRSVQALPVLETMIIDLIILASDQGHPVALTSTATITVNIEERSSIVTTEAVITFGNNGSSDVVQVINTTTESSGIEHRSCDFCSTLYENGNCDRTQPQTKTFTFLYWLIPMLFIVCTSVVICLIILLCVSKKKDKQTKVNPKKKDVPDSDNEMNTRTFLGNPPVLTADGNLSAMSIENIT